MNLFNRVLTEKDIHNFEKKILNYKLTKQGNDEQKKF